MGMVLLAIDKKRPNYQAKKKGGNYDIEKEKNRPNKMKTENEVVGSGRSNISSFVMIEEELEILTKWILEDKFRLVTIFGLKGIGKNFLSVKLTEKIKDKFEFVIWRSLSLDPKIRLLLTWFIFTQVLNKFQIISTRKLLFSNFNKC